ncbi:hypothetical protein ASPZODRAFT_101993 [Penicilliopsis zonata CBS 506.65]|uniref:Uncharacterized protein n=1 Tax=Penicilliopsis zonata CBS 506.65 TaxID=1073090 RepID=A0A1L9SA52_9EURO|nr:hypothetical protein ASPZODRAFT_101993 [Penicilliopsis zonata CBS 506.65]OJJ44063.1 hypothetical protein ASPZODRAFT_101993 [Penicilliopsis zonata CBS 506.65]
MRITPFLALLPALAAAQEQVPLADRVQGWFNKAKSYIPTPTPEVAAPVEKVVEKVVVEKTVTPFTNGNWQSLLTPSSEPQDWLVFITGGNKTCFGRCGRAEKAFNNSVALFSTDPTSPNLGYVNCDTEPILCAIWSAGAPSGWYFKVPQAQIGEERAATPLHVVYFNYTTVTPEKIYEVHSEKAWADVEAYEGAFHPTDGWLAQYNLNIVLGYVIYAFSRIPSWAMMLGISMFSRNFVSRRMPPRPAPAR